MRKNPVRSEGVAPGTVSGSGDQGDTLAGGPARADDITPRPEGALQAVAPGTVSRSGGQGDTVADGAGAFPYAKLLAFHRRQLDPLGVMKVEAELATSPRWRAHLESVRFLDLERAAAIQDGADLLQFSAESAGPLCVFAAVSKGDLFVRAARDPGSVGPETRKEWARHTRDCVFCRRMRRRAVAQVEREKAKFPKGEPLLRDWLLEDYYVKRLEGLAVEIEGRKLLERLRPEHKDLLRQHRVKGRSLEELAREKGQTVHNLEAQLNEADSAYRDARLEVEREIESLFQSVAAG